jgi:hypothetical protein
MTAFPILEFLVLRVIAVTSVLAGMLERLVLADIYRNITQPPIGLDIIKVE